MDDMRLFNTDTANQFKVVLHGGTIIIQKPVISKTGYTKDFGYGFYVTQLQRQAERWAEHKSRTAMGVVSVYEFYYKQADKLNYKIFPKMTEEWLDFIINCRLGEKHEYDIVEGPMAGDQIYNQVTLLMEQAITREEFWILAKFRYPTHQICFCSEKSLETLKFCESYEVR